jgi:hypothetical protein
MNDITTRILLLAIAIALWAQLLIGLLQPVSASAQTPAPRPPAPVARESVLQLLAFDQTVDRVKDIDSRTLEMSSRLDQIRDDVDSIDKATRLLGLDMLSVKTCVKNIGSRINIGC